MLRPVLLLLLLEHTHTSNRHFKASTHELRGSTAKTAFSDLVKSHYRYDPDEADNGLF